MEQDLSYFEERLRDIEKVSVSPVYREFIAHIKQEGENAMSNILEIPKDVAGILSRERLMGVAEEMELLTNWLDNEKSDVEEAIKQLKLEKTNKELTDTSNED